MRAFYGILLLGLVWPAAPLRAQELPGQFGLGAFVGVPFGASAKYLIDRNLAVDFGLGAQEHDIDGHIDLLTHFRDLKRQPKRGKAVPYLGLGAKFRDRSQTEFGVRFLGGVALILANAPIEIFLEVAPVLRLSPEVASDADGGIGLRYYFGAR